MSHHHPDPNKKVSLTIDGIPVTVPEGTKILEAARKANVFIPTLCDHPDLCRRAVCRICVVECDGKGKLLAACANDVWEGVSVVTNNSRIMNIRKTILELLIASHPQECLSCAASTNCELQTLAKMYEIRETTFGPDAVNRQPVSKDNALIRDMDKCVKCGRCVEACQEIQTVRAINTSHRGAKYRISTAYNRPYTDSPCVFCGQCETVCPVGAIYEDDQSAKVWAVINDSERSIAAQISKPEAESLCMELDKAFGFPSRTVSPGKTVTALKRLGFDKVYDSLFAIDLAAAEISLELKNRVKTGDKKRLPLISACSHSAVKFIENFYPDLADRLSQSRSPREIFHSLMKEEKTTTVSIEPLICNKSKQLAGEPDITLTVKELALMFKLAGTDFASLPESHFDKLEHSKPDLTGPNGKYMAVNGLGKARAVLDLVRKDQCDAVYIEIRSCPLTEGYARCASIGSILCEAIQII